MEIVHTKGNGFSLEGELEEKFRFLLNQYLKLQKEGKDASALFHDLNISYQMVNCLDYCKTRVECFIVTTIEKSEADNVHRRHLYFHQLYWN